MPPVAPMLAKPAAAIPPGQFYEPKWDGFRSVVFRDGDEVEIGSRKERPMTRYFPEVVAAIKRAFPERAVIDGEIVIAAKGGLDFWALQQRIHPAASRVDRLAAETPASFVAFDLLALGDEDLTERPFAERRAALEQALRDAAPPVHLTPITQELDVAAEWFERFEGAGLDGLIAKRADLTYQPDKRVMTKIKHVRTADCVVAGYRVHKAAEDAIGSLLLGLHVDDAAPASHWADGWEGLAPVGVIGAFPMARRRELFAELQPLIVDVAEHPWSWAAKLDQRARGRQPLEPEEGPVLRAAAAGARRRGPLRLSRRRAVPAPAAVRPLAPRPRPGDLRVRPARPARAVRPRRSARAMSAGFKRRVSTALATRIINPLVRWATRHGLAPHSYAILETTGRRSGQPRRTPVGHAVDGDTVWIVAEHGLKAGYVRNIGSNPRVRIQLRDGWRSGTARVVEDDDPRQRLRRMGLRLNALAVRLMGSDLLTVRIDLDPAHEPEVSPIE